MKNKLAFFTIISLFLLYLSCKKTNNVISNDYKNPFIDSAIQYLNAHLDESEFHELDFNSIQVFKNNKRDEIFRVYTAEKSNNRYIILAKPANKFFGNWVEHNYYSFDGDLHTKGIIKTESFNKRIRSEFWFLNDQVIKIVKSINGETQTTLIPSQTESSTLANPGNSNNTISAGVQSTEEDDNEYKVLPTITVTVYQQSSPVNFYSMYYYLNQNNSYYNSYTNVPPNYGGGTSSGGASTSYYSAVNLPILPPPDYPVLLENELKCLGTTSNINAQYFIRINVNEPEPGTRSKISMMNSYHGGHTFLTLEQRNGDGSVITRNVGFYPATGVKPGVETSSGMFGDDTSTPYCIALTVSVSASEMETVKQFLINQSGSTYSLQDNNCATNVINALSSINVQLPRTYGIIYGAGSMPPDASSQVELFKGLNPGDLGEDIRSLDANTFSAQNGNRQVIIEKSYSNNHNRSRSGNCP